MPFDPNPEIQKKEKRSKILLDSGRERAPLEVLYEIIAIFLAHDLLLPFCGFGLFFFFA